MFGPELFNDAWKIYAKTSGVSGSIESQGASMAREWIRLLAVHPPPNLAVPGTGYAQRETDGICLNWELKTRIQKLQGVVQNYPSETSSMMSGTTTGGARCNKMENLVENLVYQSEWSTEI